MLKGEKNKVACKRYYANNKEKASADRKVWYEKNKEKRSEYMRKWYTRELSTIRAKRKIKYRKDKEKIHTEGQSPNGKYKLYIKKARERSILFDLTFEQFVEFWQKPCAYCGDVITTIGIDRVDNLMPYTLNNTVACCTMCNKMKLTYSVETFVVHCEKVFLHQNLNNERKVCANG